MCGGVYRFFDWCAARSITLEEIKPLVVAGYIEALGGELAPPSVKQHLAAIKGLYDFLVTGQVVAFNPAASVRGPRIADDEGKTPILSADETEALLILLPVIRCWGCVTAP